MENEFVNFLQSSGVPVETTIIDVIKDPLAQFFTDPLGTSLIVGIPGAGVSLHFGGTGLGVSDGTVTGRANVLQFVSEITFIALAEINWSGSGTLIEPIFGAVDLISSSDFGMDPNFPGVSNALFGGVPRYDGSAGDDHTVLTTDQIFYTPGPGRANAGNLRGGDDLIDIYTNVAPLGGEGSFRANGGPGRDTFNVIDMDGSFDTTIRPAPNNTVLIQIEDATTPPGAPFVAGGSASGAAPATITTITAKLKSFETFILAGGNDSFTGTDKKETVDLGGGDDIARTKGGNDRVDGRNGNDTVNGGGGNDVINGNNGKDVLNGQDGNDRINGGLGRDEVSGGNGDDVVNPGRGNDLVRLGKGADVLVFNTASSQGHDKVLDANLAQDTFRIVGGSLGDLSVSLNSAGNSHVTGTNVDFVLVGIHSTNTADFTWDFV